MLNQTLETDVLILGGGIQGMCLLDMIASRHPNWGVLLVENNRLGSDQSSHAQGYIHQGHAKIDDPVGRILALQEAQSWWSECKSQFDSVFESRILVGFENAAYCKLHLTKAVGYNLNFTDNTSGLHIPGDLDVSSNCYISDELFVNQQELIASLFRKHKNRIAFCDVKLLGTPDDPQVQLTCLEGRSYEIRPRGIVVANGKRQLDATADWGGVNVRSDDLPQTNFRLLLVEHRDGKDLPPFRALLPDRGTMIISRMTGGKIKWLYQPIGDNFAKLDDNELRQVAQKTVASMHVDASIHPKVLQVQMTQGPPAAENCKGGRFLQLGKVFRAWPYRLTLAPLLGEQIIMKLNSVLGSEPLKGMIPLNTLIPESPIAAPFWMTL